MNSNSYFCSVCGAPIKRQQKQTILAQRTDIVCENDHICQSCCKLAVQSFRKSKANVTLEMEVFDDTTKSFNDECLTNGNKNACLMCDTSLSNRESLLIIKPDPTELDNLMLNLIIEGIPPQTKIGSKDKICSKCWFKVRRSAIDLQQINKLEPNEIKDEVYISDSESIEIKSELGSDHENSEYLTQETEQQHSKELEDQKEITESKDAGDADNSFDDTTKSFNDECLTNGNKNACLMCDTSLSNRESLLIIKPDPTELDNLMLNLIIEGIPPQTKIGSKDKICSKCWFKVRRSAIDLQQINKLEPNEIKDEVYISDSESIEIKSELGSDHENSEYLTQETEQQHSKELEDQKEITESKDAGDADNSFDETNKDLDDPDFTVKYPTNEPELSADILLPNYNRCSTTSSNCVFRNCKNSERRRVTNDIREKMLRDYKFYIPQESRVCQQHFQSYMWPDLCSPSSTSNRQFKFNTKQIEDMFSMVQTKDKTTLEFNNVLNFDDYFIEHLLGVKREILNVILTSEPKIKKICNGLNGLLGLLLKHENGSSYNRIKTLLNISRKSLKKAMGDVKTILSKSQVTKELGIKYLLEVK